MDKDLFSAYGRSNLHETLLVLLFADIITREGNAREDKNLRYPLGQYRAAAEHRIRHAVYPPESQNVEDVRRDALAANALFWREVEAVLVKEEKIECRTEPGLYDTYS